jgi:hypothetical protein
MDRASGYGGGVTAGYAEAATLAGWTLEAIGPNLYRLRATVTHRVPPLLTLPSVRLWIRKTQALAWEWTVKDGSLGVSAEGVLEAVVGQPSIRPAT